MSLSPAAASIRNEDELDLRELFIELWHRRILIAACGSAGLLIATAYAFLFAPTVYESSVLLLPTQTNNSDQLGAAAALLGKKSSSNTDVELYQSLLSSRTVLRILLDAPIQCQADSCRGKTVTVHEILGINPRQPQQAEAAIAMLRSSIDVLSKESAESGIVEVRTEARTPWLAQQLGNQLISTGQEELRRVRAARSEIILSRLGRAVDQARNEWDTVASNYTLYKDRNRSISLPNQILELSRLEIEKSAKEQKYLLARKEFEGMELEREKAAPPLMVLDSADLPAKKSKPKRSLLMLLGMASGIFLSSVAVMSRKALFSTSSQCGLA